MGRLVSDTLRFFHLEVLIKRWKMEDNNLGYIMTKIEKEIPMTDDGGWKNIVTTSCPSLLTSNLMMSLFIFKSCMIQSTFISHSILYLRIQNISNFNCFSFQYISHLKMLIMYPNKIIGAAVRGWAVRSENPRIKSPQLNSWLMTNHKTIKPCTVHFLFVHLCAILLRFLFGLFLWLVLNYIAITTVWQLLAILERVPFRPLQSADHFGLFWRNFTF